MEIIPLFDCIFVILRRKKLILIKNLEVQNEIDASEKHESVDDIGTQGLREFNPI